MGDSLYRFTDFSKFVDMVQRQSLCFVSHNKLNDPYEGFLFKKILKDDAKAEITRILKERSPSHHIPILFTLRSLDEAIHCQSWSATEETDALWRLFSKNHESVRLEIATADLANLPGVKAHPISYEDFPSIQEIVDEIISEEGNNVDLLPILLKKRKAFAHENEVRLVTDLDLTYLKESMQAVPKTLMIEQAIEKLIELGEITSDQAKNILEKKSHLTGKKYVSFEDIPDFIKSVLVNPLAPKWFVEMVGEYCKDNKLPFLGQSQLYTL